MPASALTAVRPLRGIAVRVAALVLMVAAVLAQGADQAAAETVWSWGNPVIKVETGSKNLGNRTQYVSSITIVDPGNRCDGGTAEAWVSRPGAIDFYASRQMCNSTMFWIQRWVPSGSSVCGSDWIYSPRDNRWFRGISCITIRV